MIMDRERNKVRADDSSDCLLVYSQTINFKVIAIQLLNKNLDSGIKLHGQIEYAGIQAEVFSN